MMSGKLELFNMIVFVHTWNLMMTFLFILGNRMMINPELFRQQNLGLGERLVLYHRERVHLKVFSVLLRNSFQSHCV